MMERYLSDHMKKGDFKLLGIALIVLVLISAIIYLAFTSSNDEEFVFTFTLEETANYAANEIIPIYVEEEELVQNYYAEFINLIVNDRDNAYSYVKSDVKEIDYPTIELFNNRMDELIASGILESRVEKYRKDEQDGKTIYYVTNTNGNRITFIESSIMNYEIIV